MTNFFFENVFIISRFHRTELQSILHNNLLHY